MVRGFGLVVLLLFSMLLMWDIEHVEHCLCAWNTLLWQEKKTKQTVGGEKLKQEHLSFYFSSNGDSKWSYAYPAAVE